MISALLVSGTERLLLMLGWERENNTATHRTHRTLHTPDASYGRLKSDIRNMKKRANDDGNTATATPMFGQQPTLRPARAVSHTPSQHQQARAWTSASAFDAAPSGTV